MKYVRQIGIILGITLAGEFLNQILPLPVPAGVYGLFLMLAFSIARYRCEYSSGRLSNNSCFPSGIVHFSSSNTK